MPTVTHTVAVEAPLATTWKFVKEPRNWAELMPGYEGMEELSESDSEWKIRGDVGILTKLVTMQVHVTEWVEMSHVNFTVVCKEEPLTAEGALVAHGQGDTTNLDFNLTAEAGGMLGPVVNALLMTVMPRMARDFAGGIKREIEAGVAEATGAHG
jgi:carbon monoxide dehydrogenase subunit G